MTSASYDGRIGYHPGGGTPRPPAAIWAAMEAAGKAGDDVALGVAHARYAAWLTENGHPESVLHGTPAPDAAYLPESAEEVDS